MIVFNPVNLTPAFVFIDGHVGPLVDKFNTIWTFKSAAYLGWKDGLVAGGTLGSKNPAMEETTKVTDWKIPHKRHKHLPKSIPGKYWLKEIANSSRSRVITRHFLHVTL